MIRIACALVLAIVLCGCGTRPFTPREYALSDDVVPAMTLRGTATIRNVQPSLEPVQVYAYLGTTLAASLHTVTDAMIKQANGELTRHATTVAGAPKSIDLRVTFVESSYVAFYWHSKLTYTVVLGDGTRFENTVTHAGASVAQDLNGCIADSVGEFLTDRRVVDYLARG